jgi:hypothetical protein
MFLATPPGVRLTFALFVVALRIGSQVWNSSSTSAAPMQIMGFDIVDKDNGARSYASFGDAHAVRA